MFTLSRLGRVSRRAGRLCASYIGKTMLKVTAQTTDKSSVSTSATVRARSLLGKAAKRKVFLSFCRSGRFLLWTFDLSSQNRTLTRTLSAFQFSDAHVTHTAHFSTITVQDRIEKSFHRVISRLLECDGYNFHYTLLHLRNNYRYCLAVWRYTKQTLVMSPTCRPTQTSQHYEL